MPANLANLADLANLLPGGRKRHTPHVLLYYYYSF
jgi:hypothetical protein